MAPLYTVQSGLKVTMPWWPAEAARRAAGSQIGASLHDDQNPCRRALKMPCVMPPCTLLQGGTGQQYWH